MSKELNKYAVIYADPPWQTKAGRGFAGYKTFDGVQIFNSLDTKSRELSYPSMTVDEIAALDVKSISADNAHLYMWVTNQYILEAKRVIEAWGFKYSTSIIWSKTPMGGGIRWNIWNFS